MITLDTVAAHDISRARDIAAWLAAGSCSCATINDTVVGYSTVHRHFFGRPFLDMLMVAEALRRHGIGAALIAFTIGQYPAEAIWTSTNRSNLAMQALLDRLGFKRAGIIEGLDEGDPELIFRHDCATPSCAPRSSPSRGDR